MDEYQAFKHQPLQTATAVFISCGIRVSFQYTHQITAQTGIQTLYDKRCQHDPEKQLCGIDRNVGKLPQHQPCKHGLATAVAMSPRRCKCMQHSLEKHVPLHRLRAQFYMQHTNDISHRMDSTALSAATEQHIIC